jgi:hypothetical protein
MYILHLIGSTMRIETRKKCVRGLHIIEVRNQ